MEHFQRIKRIRLKSQKANAPPLIINEDDVKRENMRDSGMWM